MQSRIPPRPGIIFPLSFISEERLNTDSIRSPVIAAIALKKPRITAKYTGPVKISGQIYLAATQEAIAPKIPPAKPAMLLFGLAAKTFLLFFPKRTPNSHARESFINTVKRKSPRISILSQKSLNIRSF